MNGTQSYVLSKAYTNNSIKGISGVLAGKNCTIKSITTSPDGKTNTVTFQWTADDGTVKTSQMIVKNGTETEIERYLDEGVKIATITIDGVQTDIYAPEGGAGGDAVLTNPLTTTKQVGGVNVGTTYQANTKLEKIIRDILAPVLYPSFTAPSVSLSGSGAKLLETGATLAVTLTATFNRGAINPAYGTSGYRAGAATGYALNGGTSQAGNTFNQTVSASNKSFTVTASYAAGEQPKDSNGDNYSSPLPAGSVTSAAVTYDFVDALWANTAAIGTIAKLALVAKSTKQKDFVFPAQTVANPEVFDVPASWTVTAVQVKNDLSGAYEDAADQFTVTNTTHNDAAGNSVNYKRYTCNLGYDTGSRTVRLKWS